MLLAMLALIGMAAPERAPAPAADPPGAVMPTRGWDVEHLHLAIRVDVDAGEVRGTATHKVAPLARPSATIRLHQVGLAISAIRVDGAEVEGWRLGPDFLDIPLSPSAPHEIAIDYSARPETGLHFRGRRGGPDAIREAWSQGEGEDNRHWFPSWDHPNDRFTFSADLTAPPGMTAHANGALVGREPVADVGEGAGWTRWSYRFDHELVTYLVAIGVGEYAEHELTGARVPMSVIGPRTMTREQATAGFDRVVPMLPFFDELLGAPYPYPNYRQLVVQRFLYGGMENTTLTLMSDELAATRPWQSADRAESVAAHELAHQWFGDLLTCYGWRELWLNEGFATYYTNRWWEHARGDANAAARRRGAYDGGLASTRPMASRSWSPNNDQPNAAVYVRGASVLHMLETYLGRQAFDAGIRLYVARHRDRLVETDDLRRALEDVSGEHLGWIFDQWVHGAGAPTYKVSHTYMPGGPDRAGSLTVVIEQTTKERPWYASVSVEIGTADGTIARRVDVGAGRTTLQIDLEQAPRWVIADPDRAVLAHWEQTQDPGQWADAARHSPRWDARLTALVALGEHPSDPGHDVLIEALGDPALDDGVREIAARSLAKLQTPRAADALLKALRSDAWRQREDAAAALGRFVGEERVLDALARAVRGDRHPEVAGAALSALGEADAARALDEARRIARGRAGPDAEPTLQAALGVLARHGALSDLDLVLPWLAPRTPRPVHSAAMRAGGWLVERHADDSKIETARARAAAAMLPSLDSQDLRTRQSTVYALSRAGDAAAAHRLTALASETRLTDLAQSARDAALAIRRRGAPPPTEPTKDDLTRLRERLEQAEKRLQQLEIWR